MVLLDAMRCALRIADVSCSLATCTCKGTAKHTAFSLLYRNLRQPFDPSVRHHSQSGHRCRQHLPAVAVGTRRWAAATAGVAATRHQLRTKTRPARLSRPPLHCRCRPLLPVARLHAPADALLLPRRQRQCQLPVRLRCACGASTAADAALWTLKMDVPSARSQTHNVRCTAKHQC